MLLRMCLVLVFLGLGNAGLAEDDLPEESCTKPVNTNLVLAEDIQLRDLETKVPLMAPQPIDLDDLDVARTELRIKRVTYANKMPKSPVIQILLEHTSSGRRKHLAWFRLIGNTSFLDSVHHGVKWLHPDGYISYRMKPQLDYFLAEGGAVEELSIIFKFIYHTSDKVYIEDRISTTGMRFGEVTLAQGKK